MVSQELAGVVSSGATVSVGPLEFDRDVFAIGLLITIVYLLASSYDANRRAARDIREVKRILNPYYDIQRRRWVDPENVDPTGSTVEVVVQDDLSDSDDEDGGGESGGE